MGVVTGRLFNTLSHRVDKEINESLYQNEVFLKSQWNFLERSVVLWSNHYIKYIVLVLLLAFFIVVNIVVWQPLVRPFVATYMPCWRDLLDWQGVFLAGQLTIVGVVYPLVVGLTSILFQNKSAKKTIFPVYQKYSGFMFAGLSGLTLSGFIVLGYFLRAVLPDSIYVAICISAALWLGGNILLTAWFFVQTFRMLDEVSRDRLVVRFSIHESCEIDVRERIKESLIFNAKDRELLVNPDEKILEVLTYNYSSNNFSVIHRHVDRHAMIHDIRYRMINIAILLQIFLLKTSSVEGGKLVIQPKHNSANGKKYTVAQYDGFKLNPIVSFLIKSAFSFRIPKVQAKSSVTSILHGFIGPANDALRDNSAKDFSDALDNIASWHTEIALALSFKNDLGKQDNWLLLPSSIFSTRSFLDELLAEYHQLARDSVEKIPENSRFYNDMLYLHKRIFSGRDVLVEREIRSLIQGSYYMWYLLIEWRSFSSGSRDQRVANKYEDILYDFVGAWESWPLYIEPRSSRAGDAAKSHLAFITHLEFTASTAISALRFNNYEAAGWGVDMLNKWFQNLSFDDYWDAEYLWRSVLLNHRHLLRKPAGSAWQCILKGNDYEQLAAFHLAFKNTSFDLRVITACYMLMKPGQSHKEILANQVKALLSGESIHSTGDSGRSLHSISNAGDLLGAYIRHRDYRHYEDESYGSWLSSVLGSFGRIDEERRVSGRIYSGWGANDPRSMNQAYVDIGISLSKRGWTLPNDWEQAIFSDAFRHVDRESISSDLRDWLKMAEDCQSCILFTLEEKEKLVANFCESVESIIDKIEKAQSKAVVDADLDQERLKLFGVAGSEIFRNLDEPSFPLSLFDRRDSDQEVSDDVSHGINILDYAKERVAQGIETNRSINENQWLADCISNNVKLNVLRHLLRCTPSETFEHNNIDDSIANIKQLSESMSRPVLFIGNQVLSNTLRRAIRDPDLSSKYDIHRRDGFDKEYICHMGQCEVYSLRFNDIDYSLLATRDLFECVNFGKVSEDQYVAVDFEPEPENESVGKLKLKYWMKVDFVEKGRCIKINLEVVEEE